MPSELLSPWVRLTLVLLALAALAAAVALWAPAFTGDAWRQVQIGR